MVDKKTTLKQVIEQVLSELVGPITIKDLADRLYAIYSTKAKTAMSSFRNCLHYDEQGYPGDNWREIVENDRRVKSDGTVLKYPEDVPPFEHMMLPDDEQLPWIRDSYTKKQSNDVYRFKVSLGFNSPVWRVIEIKAGQTFANLDVAIRDAFGHDTSDHMGGFWKLIPRGKSQKKFREVEIGNINPLEEGTAAD
jgi:hypothetical protein